LGVKLIQINRSGTPQDGIGILPDLAREVCSGTVKLYETVDFIPPWIGYLATVEGRVVGSCGFKSPPRAGRVEIAYFTFPEFEGNGYATGMAQELLALAKEIAPDVLVVAQTLPEENASTSILKRVGFRLAGPVSHPEDGLVWEWHKIEIAQPSVLTRNA
jgi:RimJ/RimL family protein N-acetyltransferase